MIVVLAEKPSVARDIARVLGADAKREGYLEGNGYRVTWAIGHLVGLAQPDAIDPAWKLWSRASLPMLPERFPLIPLPAGRAQLRIVARLLRDSSVRSLIAATDAGREGELIFRYIYEATRCRKPWQRLWLSSLTPAAIRGALAALEPGSRFDGLAAAARARSQADWLVGMNLSRAYTLTSGTLFSVGRVQTPTLAMIAARDREIEAFVPEPYLELEATFQRMGAPSHDRGAHELADRYKGTYYPAPKQTLLDARGRLRPFRPLLARLPPDGELAKTVAARVRAGSARVEYLDQSLRATPPPQLFDLTELQRRANQLYGLSAQQTLDAAQTLYERHKALSYPRTDSRHLSTAAAAMLPEIVTQLAPRYPGLLATDSGKRPLSKRFVDDAKVGDHHALLPTTTLPLRLPANSPEARIHDLVCRRLLMAWHDDLVEGVTRAITAVTSLTASGASGQREVDRFATQGISVERAGWTALEHVRQGRPNAATPAGRPSEPRPKLPPGLGAGEPVTIDAVTVHRKQTQPPRAYTEASLLSAMETAGRQLEDRALIEAMRESGLGTPATRASTIETLLTRGYIVRQGKSLSSTALGRALVAAVHPLVRSPELTGRWEQRLRRMERGQDELAAFMRDIAAFVSEVVGAEAEKPAAARQRHAAANPRKAGAAAKGRARRSRRFPRRRSATRGRGPGNA